MTTGQQSQKDQKDPSAALTACKEALFLYKELVEKQIALHEKEFGSNKALKEACCYALLNGGKRYRPAIVLMIAKALGQKTAPVKAALAVEYFHAASLIADDLPCMDNEKERRGKPATHIAFDEATALLASYSLIAAGYQKLSQATKEFPGREDLCCLAIENVSQNTGVFGASGGQQLDLFPPDKTKETVLEILEKKTVTLFEISFVLGWLFGGGDKDLLPKVKKAAYHYGMAFQIVDDFGDIQQDKENECAVNIVLALGVEEAKKVFVENIEAFFKLLKELKIATKELLGLGEFLRIIVRS